MIGAQGGAAAPHGMGEMTVDQEFEQAEDIFRAIPEIAEDMTARPNGEASEAFLTALQNSPTPEEAITFCAYLLPSRQAVWWGHECLIHEQDRLTPRDQEMLALARDWVARLDEESRYAALDAAMDSPQKSPGVWIAMAAGCAAGSLAPPDQPNVAAAPHLTPRAINAGVLSVLARVETDARHKTIVDFSRMGLHILHEA